jgi:hypothetical protein
MYVGSGTCCSRKEDTKDGEEADLRIRILTVLAKGEQLKNKALKRLDQGHLHPKLEVPGLTCPGRESNPGFAGGRHKL